MYWFDPSRDETKILIKVSRSSEEQRTSRISQTSTPSLNRINARKLPLPGAKRTLRIGLRFILNDLKRTDWSTIRVRFSNYGLGLFLFDIEDLNDAIGITGQEIISFQNYNDCLVGIFSFDALWKKTYRDQWPVQRNAEKNPEIVWQCRSIVVLSYIRWNSGNFFDGSSFDVKVIQEIVFIRKDKIFSRRFLIEFRGIWPRTKVNRIEFPRSNLLRNLYSDSSKSRWCSCSDSVLLSALFGNNDGLFSEPFFVPPTDGDQSWNRFSFSHRKKKLR